MVLYLFSVFAIKKNKDNRIKYHVFSHTTYSKSCVPALPPPKKKIGWGGWYLSRETVFFSEKLTNTKHAVRLP